MVEIKNVKVTCNIRVKHKKELRAYGTINTGKGPFLVDLKTIFGTEAVERILHPITGKRDLASHLASRFAVTSVDIAYVLNPKQYVFKLSNPERIHVTLLHPLDERTVVGALQFLQDLSSDFYAAYVGIGPNVSVYKDARRRITDRLIEGGMLTNVVAHGATFILMRPFLRSFREALEKLRIRSGRKMPEEIGEELLIYAAYHPRKLPEIKRKITSAVLSRAGLINESYPEVDVNHYRESFNQGPKEVVRVAPLGRGLDVLNLGVDGDGRLWLGFSCGEKLCFSIRPEIKIISRLLAVEGEKYYRFLVNEARKRMESYYSHIKELVRNRSLGKFGEPRKLNDVLGEFRSLDDVKMAVSYLAEELSKSFVKRMVK